MDDFQHQINELKNKLNQIEKQMKNMDGQGLVYFVNIEKADIQGPVVDKLQYTFDKLDVKEVSGALNLGNNFGVNVEEKKKKKPEQSKKEQKKQTDEKKKTPSSDSSASSGGTRQPKPEGSSESLRNSVSKLHSINDLKNEKEMRPKEKNPNREHNLETVKETAKPDKNLTDKSRISGQERADTMAAPPSDTGKRPKAETPPDGEKKARETPAKEKPPTEMKRKIRPLKKKDTEERTGDEKYPKVDQTGTGFSVTFT